MRIRFSRRALGPGLVVLAALSTAGVAGAATGGGFVLGKTNAETSTSVLRSSSGTPLSLRAAHGHPPLTVSNDVEVNRLDAEYVGGVPATALQRTITGRCETGIAAISASGAVSCTSDRLVITSSTSWVVPSGVTSVLVDAVGGGGGGGLGAKHRTGGGGAGSVIAVSLAVHPGETLDLVVGAGGAAAGHSSGQPGAGGAGGWTGIYRDSGAGELLARAGGGQGGTTGSSAAACALGQGGVPGRLAGGGAIGLVATRGDAGGCPAGGGVAGFAGAGGAAGHADASAAAGRAGVIVLSLATSSG